MKSKGRFGKLEFGKEKSADRSSTDDKPAKPRYPFNFIRKLEIFGHESKSSLTPSELEIDPMTEVTETDTQTETQTTTDPAVHYRAPHAKSESLKQSHGKLRTDLQTMAEATAKVHRERGRSAYDERLEQARQLDPAQKAQIMRKAEREMQMIELEERARRARNRVIMFGVGAAAIMGIFVLQTVGTGRINHQSVLFIVVGIVVAVFRVRRNRF